MRVATYNVENLFSHVTAMNSDDPAKTTAVLADAAELQELIEKPLYSDRDKKQSTSALLFSVATAQNMKSTFREGIISGCW
jgi:hypothetical protein